MSATTGHSAAPIRPPRCSTIRATSACRIPDQLSRCARGVRHGGAYGGYGELYAADRRPGPVLEAGCIAHARRKFFGRADVEGSVRKKSGERTGAIYPDRTGGGAAMHCSISSARSTD
ncbi:transposase [Mesorhizobium sp. M0843]|uniref:IS66 family transposase n=1 Tax=Mesorhizobium sp. M0843 TaxID=2957010 RepID=UPI00333D2180